MKALESELSLTFIKKEKYESGFNNLQKAFTRSNMLIKSQTFQILEKVEPEKNEEFDTFLIFLIIILLLTIIFVFLRVRLTF